MAISLQNGNYPENHRLQNEIVIPTGAQLSGEPALSEVEGDLRLMRLCANEL
jgi:hypothetical protein